MMISSETYYELNLKGKNEKELLSAIRGLKNKIGHLKNIMEHPDYRPLVKPDEETQIWCMSLYLERAIQALKDMGGTYTPSKAEFKVKEFNDNIPYIKEINFRIGGFTYGHTDYTFKFEDNKVKKIITKILDEDGVELSLEDKDDFLDCFAALNIGEWRSNYDTERFGYYVMDGTQWELEIYYSNGNKTKSYYGSNAYPYNFNKLLELVEYDYEDEEDDTCLNYTINLDDKNDLLKQMYEKAKELPFGTEISTSELLDMISKNSSYIDGKYVYDDLALEMKDMFALDLEFKATAADHGIKIDDTIHADEVLGMPFHIGF